MAALKERYLRAPDSGADGTAFWYQSGVLVGAGGAAHGAVPALARRLPAPPPCVAPRPAPPRLPTPLCPCGAGGGPVREWHGVPPPTHSSPAPPTHLHHRTAPRAMSLCAFQAELFIKIVMCNFLLGVLHVVDPLAVHGGQYEVSNLASMPDPASVGAEVCRAAAASRLPAALL
jgi:hypothetical protein